MENTTKNWKQLVLSTDGRFVSMAKNELASDLETMAVLEAALLAIRNSNRQPLPQDSEPI